MIEIRTLGPPDTTIDGAVPAGRSLHRKNLGLLVYLGRSPSRTRTRDQLVGLLWSESPDQAARHSLRQAIRDLKGALGSDAFVASTHELRLAEHRFTFDFDRFEQLRGGEQWEPAASLVRGEFMEGFSVRGTSPFEDWLSAERATWRRRSLDVLLQASESRLGTGDVSRAADHAAAALRLDPHSDAAVQAAMRCAALQGNEIAAQDLYRLFCQRLAELEVEPNPHTRELAQSIAHDRKSVRLPSTVGRPTSPATPKRRIPLTGRAAEFATALTLWNDTKTLRRGRVLIVDGEPGMGKTRMVDDVGAVARLDGAAVSSVRAVEADEEARWSGVVGLVTGGLLDMPGLVGAAPADLAAIATIVPAMADHIVTSVTDSLPPIELAVSRALRSVCEEQPTFVVFDDAHYLDDSTLRLIHYIARDLADLPCLIAVTASPHHPRPPIEELRARIDRDLAGCSIRLGSLGEDALRSLSKHMLPQYDDDALRRLAHRIAVDSAGIPLLAVELLQAVALGLEWEETSGAWPQPGRTLDQTPPGDLPQPIVGAIRAAFWRAPSAARRVLQMVAAIGGRVSLEQLSRVRDLDRTELDEALDWLEWERWLISERRGYTFAARIVREIVLRDMLRPGQAERFREQVEGSTRDD